MISSFTVLVEGPNDREVCRHLFEEHGLHFLGIKDDPAPSVGAIKDLGGYTNLLKAVPVAIKDSGLEALAIVVDADTEIKSRWESLRDTIRRAGYPDFPDNPSLDGTVLNEPGMPLIGVWIMPDNSSSGILEDFVAALIPNADMLWPRAHECVDSIPFEHRPFKEEALPKVKIQTWLAWQKEPGARMGEAIGRTYLDSHSHLATRMVEWIRRMIDQKPSFQTQPNVLG